MASLQEWWWCPHRLWDDTVVVSDSPNCSLSLSQRPRGCRLVIDMFTALCIPLWQYQQCVKTTSQCITKTFPTAEGAIETPPANVTQWAGGGGHTDVHVYMQLLLSRAEVRTYTFASVACDLGEFHTLPRASVWALLLHYAETAIKQNSLVATFPFMFSSMSRCWYKLPPRVTLQILNTCLALINSSQVFQAPWKCYLRFFFSPRTNFPAVGLIVLTTNESIFGCISDLFLLVYSTGNDQRKVSEHPGEVQEVTFPQRAPEDPRLQL